MEAANYGILSLIPLALTLLLAFWKKDAVFALFMGCLSGVLLLGHDPAFGFSALAEEALGNEDFIWILLIQVFIGIMIAFFMKAGVVKAFAEMIAGKVKSPRSVKLATWFIGLFTIDDYMSPLLRGVVMRPLTDEMRVPREKLAFLLDSTCASVCTLMPFMAWGAYVAGLVADLGGPVTSNEQGVSVYISAIPFNFYAILMVLITLLSALEIFPDFGPMRKAEQRARTTGKLLRDGAVPMMGTELEELQKGNDSDVKPNVMLDFLIPIIILVATAIWTYIAKGGVKILECFIITVIYMSIELSIRKVFKSVTDLVNTAVQGMKSVMSATLILALAYCINTITKSMGAADFLLGVCESWMTPALFLSVAFIAGSVISFFTGSSWGTFAICIPIAVPMAYSFTGGQLGTLVYAAVGAVVSGGLFGDHCSPVSDTTVLSSLGAACDHIDHVRTQLPYALLAAAVSIILWIDLNGNISAVVIIHQVFDHDVKIVRTASRDSIDSVVNCDQSDPIIRKKTINILSGVDIFTPEAGQIFYNDTVHNSGADVIHHTLKVRTVIICPCISIVFSYRNKIYISLVFKVVQNKLLLIGNAVAFGL